MNKLKKIKAPEAHTKIDFILTMHGVLDILGKCMITLQDSKEYPPNIKIGSRGSVY